MNERGRISARLGRLVIAFEGVNEISRHVVDEIVAALPPTDDAPHLVFRFVPKAASQPSTVRTTTRGLIVDLPEKEGEKTFTVAARPRFPDFVIGSDLAIKFLEMNYLSLNELRAKNFVYKLFNWAIQLYQLDLGQSFIHASALTKGGRTLAVLGKGGVGKTSAMLKLCLEDGWQYLSDDLAVIDESGTIYRSPARMQVYAYNTQGEADLERRLMQNRSPFDRLQWSLRRRLFGIAKVRRRVSAEFLFGAEGVAKSAKLSELVFLERNSKPGVLVSEITDVRAAERMAPIVMNEIKAYLDVHTEVERVDPGRLPSPATLEERTRELLRRSFSHARAKLMTVGPEVGPRELAQALRGLIGAPAHGAAASAVSQK
jgi:hypothetical protein